MKKQHLASYLALCAPLVIVLSSCSITNIFTRQPSQTSSPSISNPASNAQIILPELPTRVQIQTPGLPVDPNTKYVQHPTQVKPNGTYKAPKDGGWVWNGKDLQALIYGLVEPWKWIDKAAAIVENHNQSAIRREKVTKASTWLDRLLGK